MHGPADLTHERLTNRLREVRSRIRYERCATCEVKLVVRVVGRWTVERADGGLALPGQYIVGFAVIDHDDTEQDLADEARQLLRELHAATFAFPTPHSGV